MPSIPIIMPQLGESIAEATVVNLLVQVGDQVQTDQDIIEVETNKATMNVASPCPGRVEKFLVKLGESYPVGAVLGYLRGQPGRCRAAGPGRPGAGQETGRDGQRPSSSGQGSDRRRAEERPADRARLAGPGQRRRRQLHVPAHESAHGGTGPARGRPGRPAGSGAAGRVTIQDFEKFIANLEKHKLSQASTMRVAVADAMRRSWTRPLATVALPVCFDPLLSHRKTCNPKPGPALYALRALALALAENSAPAGRLIGNKIVHPSCH